jgi:AcrR family transcriptional regulator
MQARMALIQAGIQEFGELGPTGASARTIAVRAGQNIAAIAYYFGGKEGLYQAIAGYIVETMEQRNGPLLNEIETFLAQAKRPPAQCLAYLQSMFERSFYGSDNLVALSQMIVREQTHPTAAFDILFKGSLERPHRLGSQLIAAYLGGDANAPEFIVRYHMMLGSVLAFRVARETLLRRLGWSDTSEEDKAAMSAMGAEHVELILRGLRVKRSCATIRTGTKKIRK